MFSGIYSLNSSASSSIGVSSGSTTVRAREELLCRSPEIFMDLLWLVTLDWPLLLFNDFRPMRSHSSAFIPSSSSLLCSLIVYLCSSVTPIHWLWSGTWSWLCPWILCCGLADTSWCHICSSVITWLEILPLWSVSFGIWGSIWPLAVIWSDISADSLYI